MSDSPKLISVRCNHCGAPLELAPGARFVTCTHCGSQLQVHQTASAVYTEVLGEIADRTERIEQDLQTIKRQNEVEALDREWEARRESLLVRGKNGSTSTPSVGGGILAGVIAVVGGTTWIIFTMSMGGDDYFPLFGLLFIAVGIGVAFSQISKANNYAKTEADYRRRREQLARQSSEPAQR